MKAVTPNENVDSNSRRSNRRLYSGHSNHGPEGSSRSVMRRITSLTRVLRFFQAAKSFPCLGHLKAQNRNRGQKSSWPAGIAEKFEARKNARKLSEFRYPSSEDSFLQKPRIETREIRRTGRAMGSEEEEPGSSRLFPRRFASIGVRSPEASRMGRLYLRSNQEAIFKTR